jgi:DUF971 family protein
MMHEVTELKYLQKQRCLEITFAEMERFQLSSEYLRVFTPSAERLMHQNGAGVLITGKKKVNITAIEPVGQYAVKLIFDDNHNTGIYSWDYLYQLAEQQETNWPDYLQRLTESGASREQETT